MLLTFAEPGDDLPQRDSIDHDGLYDHEPDSQWSRSLERNTNMGHFQNRKYERAQQARTRYPYRGSISQEPSRRRWQGNVKQCSPTGFKTSGIADERSKDPSARQV